MPFARRQDKEVCTMMTIVTHVQLKPGGEGEWDRTIQERLRVAEGRPGWVLETGETRRAAQEAALAREQELRSLYAPDMPACHRVLTVDPRGNIQSAGRNDAETR
jgi:hypothetical protein